MVFEKSHPYSGFFFAFEGADGVGKTTQVDLLYDALQKEKFDVIKVREPGGTFYGEKIRAILKNHNEHMFYETELLLMNASRAQLVREVIIPSLLKGKIVLSDRYILSTFVYQGFGRGLSFGDIDLVNRIATAGLEPDLTFILEDSSFKRKGTCTDRIDNNDPAFIEKIQKGYKEIINSDLYCKRKVVLPYIHGNPKKVNDLILQNVFNVLSYDLLSKNQI